MEKWQDKIIKYAEKYNLPLEFLSDVLYEPKVVPMIRGKAFEFSVMVLLQKILNSKSWEVKKTMLNAQLGFHDMDVEVINKKTNKSISVECKLAKKGSFRKFSDGHVEIAVKCMRSRTLGPSQVTMLAPKLKINEKTLAVHNDQYLPGDFDCVVTSIGNAFYQTNTTTSLFEWKPKKSGETFLSELQNKMGQNKDLKDFAFACMYIARSSDLVVSKTSGVLCTRKKCINKDCCGFIPNYPKIVFDKQTLKPINGWFPISEAETVLKSLL